MLDFKELGADGTDLELLTRELLVSLGYHADWSGKGQDDGKDLLCQERGDPNFGAKERTWLVSCKHNARSGRSVSVEDVDDFTLRCRQHHAEGFLLVCTTQASSGLTSAFAGVEKNSAIRTHVWDRVTLERLLTSPRGWAIAQHFMPSTANDWKVWGTEAPNRWAAAFRGFYVHVSYRVTSSPDVYLGGLEPRFDEIEAVQQKLPDNHLLRPRKIFWDDKNGGYVWTLDLLVPRDEETQIRPEQVENALGSGIAREDGQWHDFKVRLQEYYRYSDHFDRDHYRYYDVAPWG